MTSSSDSLPFVLKTNLHPVYHHPILPPISADSILTSLQASTRSSSSKRPRSPSRSPSPSSPSTPRTKIQKLSSSSSSSSSSIPSPHHLNFNTDTLSPSPPRISTLFDQSSPHTLSRESQLSTSIPIDSPNLPNVNQINFKPAVSSIDSISENECSSSNFIPDRSPVQTLLSPSKNLINVEMIQSDSHSLLPALDCPNPLASSESLNLHTIGLAAEMFIEPAITPSSSPLSSPLSSPPSIGPTHTPQAALSPTDHLLNLQPYLQKPSDPQEHQIQSSSSSPQKLSSDTFKMPTLLKLTPSKPASPLTFPYSPSSSQVIRDIPSSTSPGLSACPITYSSLSSLDPSVEHCPNKLTTIHQDGAPKSSDVQSSSLEKEGPQTTTSTSINETTPPNLKNFNSTVQSSPGSINQSKGFFSRTTMTERPDEMKNILPNSIELGYLFKSGSSHLCPPDRSPPLRTSPTKPLMMESTTSALNLSEAFVELQSEKENGEGLLTKRPSRGSKISQRLEAMKKQTKRKAGRVESDTPISNSTSPSTVFRENNPRLPKNDSNLKLISVTKRFTSLNENRVCVVKVEDWEMKKPRPTSPVSFSKTCRKYIKDRDEDEDCELEDLGIDEKSASRFRKVKWKKPLAEDVEIVGKLMEVPKKGILVKKDEMKLDSDGNLMGESHVKISPEFVIVKRKVWSR